MSELEQAFGPTCEAVVKASDRITPADRDEIRRISCYVDDPSFRVTEGQIIGVVVPGPHPFGNKYHMRHYSVAGSETVAGDEGIDFELLVRRCFYLDEVSGERFPGIASNYLCDAEPGRRVTVTGPYRNPFHIPADTRANLLMIGTGTGVAPFRTFIQRVYAKHPDWQGQVRLFYGARSGMDLLYLNDQVDDLTNYYDEKTFKAFKGLVSRPLADDEQGLEHTLESNAGEAWELLQEPNTYVFLAGLDKVVAAFDRVMAKAAGSMQAWESTKERMVEDGHWAQLIYS